MQKDGTKVDTWGANPKGMLVLDANGRYVLVINRSDLPKFASNRRDQGTAEENKAVMKGLIVTFGTYSVNEADKTLTTKVEGGSFPNFYGVNHIAQRGGTEVYQPCYIDWDIGSSHMEACEVGAASGRRTPFMGASVAGGALDTIARSVLRGRDGVLPSDEND